MTSPDDEAWVRLAGLLAYGELCGFEQLAQGAATAPDFAGRVAMLELAAHRMADHQRLIDHLRRQGLDPLEVMRARADAFDDYHRHTTPRTWGESLVKAYVGDGLARDLCTEAARVTGGELGAILTDLAAAGEGRAEFATEAVAQLLAEDPSLAGRLALWARRLVGEALSQAQRATAADEHLADAVVGAGDGTGSDLAGLTAMFARLVQRHNERMARLGLRS